MENVDLFKEVAFMGVDIKNLKKRLSEPKENFNAWPDYYAVLDEGDEIEFMGVKLKPSKMAEMTIDQDGSTVRDEYSDWLDSIEKEDITEYKDAVSKMTELGTKFNELLDQVAEVKEELDAAA